MGRTHNIRSKRTKGNAMSATVAGTPPADPAQPQVNLRLVFGGLLPVGE